MEELQKQKFKLIPKLIIEELKDQKSEYVDYLKSPPCIKKFFDNFVGKIKR